MKKIKKILAAVMTLAMVLGMSMTTFAATESRITINNAGTGKFYPVQIVTPDTSADTGWEIVTEYKDEFAAAFPGMDTQRIIKGMIYSVDRSAEEGMEIPGFEASYQSALEAICASIEDDTVQNSGTTAVDGVATLTVTSTNSTSGVWVIKGLEDGYNYSPMAAYINFAGVATGEVNAKKAPTSVEKDTTDDDGTYEVGDIITYTIDARVPYIPASDENRSYIVTDTINGAVYNTTSGGILNVTVTLKESLTDPNPESTTIEVVPKGNTFTLDLSDYLFTDRTEDKNPTNNYQNYYLTISYEAKTTGTKVGNDVTVDDGTHEGNPIYGSDGSNLVSGTVTLTKTGEGDAPLADAFFVVVKTTESTEEGTPDTIEYGTFSPEGVLTGWVSDEKNATRLETDAEGKITVSGLDPHFAGYAFKEVEAPDGYSINNDDAEVTWEAIPGKGDITDDTSVVSGTASMTDTKLASLPSTGGIGTTIFTIGGCVIMIAAAGLFFASRRKSSK